MPMFAEVGPIVIDTQTTIQADKLVNTAENYRPALPVTVDKSTFAEHKETKFPIKGHLKVKD